MSYRNISIKYPNEINVDVSSPSTSVDATVNLPSATESTVNASPIDNNCNVVLQGLPGPQGPIGPQGPSGLQGAQGPMGIPNTGELDERYVLLTGNQNISGNNSSLNFTSGARLLISGIPVLTGNLSNYYTTDNPSGFINSLPNTILHTTGDQTISGIKNFIFAFNEPKSLRVRNTGVMLEGDAAPLQIYNQINMSSFDYPSYYTMNGSQFAVCFSNTPGTKNLVLPQSPKNNTICDIIISPTIGYSEFTLSIYTVPGAIISLQSIANLQGGANGKLAYIKFIYIDGNWRVYPSPPPHASTHSKYQTDPISPINIGAVPELSNYYGNKLQANVSVAGSYVYQTTSQFNGKSYWSTDTASSIFNISWNSTNNSWEQGLGGPPPGLVFVRSFHNVPEPYMATGWQSVNYGANMLSIYRLPNVDITNQQIQGNLLIDNVYANNLIYNTGNQTISGQIKINKNLTLANPSVVSGFGDTNMYTWYGQTNTNNPFEIFLNNELNQRISIPSDSIASLNLSVNGGYSASVKMSTFNSYYNMRRGAPTITVLSSGVIHSGSSSPSAFDTNYGLNGIFLSGNNTNGELSIFAKPEVGSVGGNTKVKIFGTYNLLKI